MQVRLVLHVAAFASQVPPQPPPALACSRAVGLGRPPHGTTCDKELCIAVPFTPSQGVVTPSPTNIAAQRFYQQYCGPWPQPMSPAQYPGVYQHGWTPVRISYKYFVATRSCDDCGASTSAGRFSC